MDTASNVMALAGGDLNDLGTDADLLATAFGLSPDRSMAGLTALLGRHRGSLTRAVSSLLDGEVVLPGLGPHRRRCLGAALQLATRMSQQKISAQGALEHPASCNTYLQHHYRLQTREVFTCLFLNSRHQLLACRDMFFGTLDSATVYPREVVATALRLGASAVIAAHNHPSGTLTPSAADLRLTERLRSALELLDMRLLDHLVVGQGDYLSMASEGIAGFPGEALR